MPRKSADERIANYETGLDPEHVKQMFERRKAGMIIRHTNRVTALAAMEDMVKSSLADEENVTTLLYPYYYDFARQVFKLHTKIPGGKAHDREVRILIDTWTSRELDERILVKIADEVLGVKVPGGWK
jgi:hypothetical protein